MTPFGRLVVVVGSTVVFIIFYQLAANRAGGREYNPVLAQQALAETAQAMGGLLVLLAGFHLLLRRTTAWPPLWDVVGPVLALLGGLLLMRPEWATAAAFGAVGVGYMVWDALARWSYREPPPPPAGLSGAAASDAPR